MNETKRDREIRMAYEERFDAWRRLLPSSRMTTKHATVMSPIGMVELIYCINCGRGGGAVTANVPDVMYLCQSCADTHGGLPAPEIPAELVQPHGD